MNRIASSGTVAAPASKMRRVARPQLPPVRNWMNTMAIEPRPRPSQKAYATR